MAKKARRQPSVLRGYWPDWMTARDRLIARRLAAAYRALNPRAGSYRDDARTRDFVFHMTDWSADLQRLAKLYRQPETGTAEDWEAAVFGMLQHAIGHLLAAGQLNWDGEIWDPFKVLPETGPAAATASPVPRSARTRNGRVRRKPNRP